MIWLINYQDERGISSTLKAFCRHFFTKVQICLIYDMNYNFLSIILHSLSNLLDDKLICIFTLYSSRLLSVITSVTR